MSKFFSKFWNDARCAGVAYEDYLLAFRVTGLYPWDPTIVTKNKAKVNGLAPPEPPKVQGIYINSAVLTKGNCESAGQGEDGKKTPRSERQMKKRRNKHLPILEVAVCSPATDLAGFPPKSNFSLIVKI
jgi:hypothetical protein